MLLHFLCFIGPKFEENEGFFEVAMDGQTFYRVKRERERENELRINPIMVPHVGVERGRKRERTLIIKSL